jgi:hypothetical protein
MKKATQLGGLIFQVVPKPSEPEDFLDYILVSLAEISQAPSE